MKCLHTLAFAFVALACWSPVATAQPGSPGQITVPSLADTHGVPFARTQFQPSAYGPTEYWNRIRELTPPNPLEAAPARDSYLRSLTKDQMLEAARQYAAEVTATTTATKATWQDGPMVGVPLTYYLRKDNGGLDDDRLAALLACVTGCRDTTNTYFAECVVFFLRGDFWFRGALDEGQRSFCREVFLSVARDGETPPDLRIMCCENLAGALQEEYRQTALKDKNVRPLVAAKTDVATIFARIRSGSLEVEPGAKESLKLLRKEIRQTWPILRSLSEDPTQPAKVRMASLSASHLFTGNPIYDGD